MPPNQQTPNGQHDPYAFITQAPAKPKRSFLSSSNSPKQRLIIGLGLFGILFLFGIVLTLILTSGGGQTDNMLRVAQTQQEIIRISSGGIRDLRDPATLAFTQNTLLTTMSDQSRNIAYITEFSKKPDAKRLALAQDSSTDTKLEAGRQAGRYDETFYDALYDELLDYRTQLSQTYESASPRQKELLQGFYNNVNTLLRNQAPPTN